MRFALFTLALAAFAIGTTEFTPMGLLPVIADDLGISIPKAGMLISAYAIGVLVGAPLMTLAFGVTRRKFALIGLMAIFTIGNILSAIAPEYVTLVITRIFTSFCHGAFFGLGAVVAAGLVPKNKQAGAVATMFLGLTIANLCGVPIATWLGQTFGWRASFAATAGLGVASMIALAIAIPRGEPGKMPNVRGELRVLARPAVLAALLTTVLGSASTFTLYTYIAVILQHHVSATPAFVTAMLVVTGIGFTLGNFLSGRAADHSIRTTLLVTFSLFAAVMFIFPLVATTTIGVIITLIIWGMLSFALVPPVQMQVMRVAHEAPGLASSVNIGAFNFGNAIGAAAGGLVVSAGWGVGAIAPVGGLFALAGFALIYFNAKDAH
jgi:DHA1 family inner membrane transport protein